MILLAGLPNRSIITIAAPPRLTLLHEIISHSCFFTFLPSPPGRGKGEGNVPSVNHPHLHPLPEGEEEDISTDTQSKSGPADRNSYCCLLPHACFSRIRQRTDQPQIVWLRLIRLRR